MLLIALLILPGTLAGAISGALTARWLVRRSQRRQMTVPAVPLTDPSVSAGIDQAAAAWANAQGRPQAKGLMADKLYLLHRIGRRRGWWSR